MEQLLQALANLLAPYLPKPNISDLEINLKIEKAIDKELRELDFDDSIHNYLEYNDYQTADEIVESLTNDSSLERVCTEIAKNEVTEYIDESLRDEIKDVLRNVTFDV